MTEPRYSFLHLTRWALSAAAVAAGLMLIVVALFDPFGLERDRTERATRAATTVLLCERIETYAARLAQLQGIIDEVGPSGLTRNERDVLETFTAGMERLRAAQQLLGVECDDGRQ